MKLRTLLLIAALTLALMFYKCTHSNRDYNSQLARDCHDPDKRLERLEECLETGR